jgi:PEP-CTERM/exosortase A-associated glycosyltransferase
MTLRVLHVLDHSLPLQSGYAFRTLALLREQRAMGWETFHLTTPKHYAASPDEEQAAGMTFMRTNVRPSILRRLPVMNNAMVVWDTQRRLEQVWDRVRPDIVHAHSPCLTGLAALAVAHKRNTPVVYEMRATWEDAAVDHGTTTAGSLRYRLTRGLETSVIRRADAVVAICEGLASEIASRGVPRERISIVRNAVNIRDFDVIENTDDALRRELGLGAGPVLGFIGSLYGYEGIDVLVAAMPAILREHSQASVLLVGGGPAEAQVKQLAAQLGITERIRFVGRVPNDQVRRYYSVIDVLAYPRKSTRLTELVTPLKPLEAMSLGRCFIASDVGGHRELIPQHLRANLFKADDPADLARVALRVLAERAGWAPLLAQGRQYVATQCTWALSAANYRDVYATAAKRGKAAAEYAHERR